LPPFYVERLRCELSLVKLRDDESLNSYVTQFCGKVHVAYIGVKSRFVEAQLMWQFINNLYCEKLRLKALEQQCLTLAEVADYVLEFETKCKDWLKSRSKTPSPYRLIGSIDASNLESSGIAEETARVNSVLRKHRANYRTLSGG